MAATLVDLITRTAALTWATGAALDIWAAFGGGVKAVVLAMLFMALGATGAVCWRLERTQTEAARQLLNALTASVPPRPDLRPVPAVIEATRSSTVSDHPKAG